MRKKLKNKSNANILPDTKSRPNDLQRLVLSCINSGMTVSDARYVFGIAEFTIREWRTKYSEVETEEDKIYFMRRARELGADDETIATWFGFDRVDKVSMILAEKS